MIEFAIHGKLCLIVSVINILITIILNSTKQVDLQESKFQNNFKINIPHIINYIASRFKTLILVIIIKCIKHIL